MSTTIDLEQFVDISNNARHRLCDYIVDCVVDAVDFARGCPQNYCCPPSNQPEYACLRKFVILLVTLSHPLVHSIAVALVYIDRLIPTDRFVLGNAARERLVFGALMLASKHQSDDPLMNGDWSTFGLPFSRKEIDQMDLYFLDALEHDLQVSHDELLEHSLSIVEILSSLRQPWYCPDHSPSRPMNAQYYPPHHYAASGSSQTLAESGGRRDIGGTLATSRGKSFRALWRWLRRTRIPAH
ncbi:hypothetical protein F5J12DRAFT_923994 [Pisolithus orientalis]|uniref:uncharacterized protein n=1 Tax=Pisolithus orientalis TaxID=936130 RepID=UPI0022254A1A|nr:uncharacterized protein F5J12DRAFT_923994 [Pisolithus orientalis]KAI6034948.1 hypothetical protein F5J12DRAFT_923994 [Pisolithus orientalis]